jgi:hypothetical protein
MLSKYVVLILVIALGGCTYTLPDGSKVARDVYRMEAQQELLKMANEADREYDKRNPIQPPPQVCVNPDITSMSGPDLAYCAMAMATYNAQLQVREERRKASSHYAAIVIDRQEESRERRMDRWFSLAGLVYQTERVASRQSTGPTTKISVRGHTVSGRGASGGGGASGGLGGGDELAGVGGAGGSGGAGGGTNIGDMVVNVNTGANAQVGGGVATTFAPALEMATDLGSTSPVLGEGASDNRSNPETMGLTLDAL